MDPPALWRPPLAVLALVPIESLIEDPAIVYNIFAMSCLAATTLGLFYLMKHVGGLAAAHFSQLFAFTLPMFVMLVNRQLQMLSYLIMFAVVVAALLATMSAWTKLSKWGDARVGLLWGLAFLARPETIVFFGVTLFVSAVVYWRVHRSSRTVLRQLFLQALCFLLLYGPVMATYRHVQRTHDLIGQEPLMTYYAGEYFASNTPAADPDGEGYAASVRRYGDPSLYGHSFVRFALAQPDAVLTRIRQNIVQAIDLLSRRAVHMADWIVFIVFGAMLGRSTSSPIPGMYLLLCGALLTAASTYFLLFHIDPRYLLAFLLMLLFFVQTMAVLLWRQAGRYWRDSALERVVVAICTMVLVGLLVARVSTAITTAREGAIDVTSFRALAERFRAEIGTEGTPAVGFVPLNSDAMWISYFANTSIPWLGDTALFPRDKVYSFTVRAPDYLLIPGSTDLRSIGNPPVLWTETFPRIGVYACVDVRPTPSGIR
jgi:ABC-type multidrug transport system fused ATPase/permease subunit